MSTRRLTVNTALGIFSIMVIVSLLAIMLGAISQIPVYATIN